MEQGTILDRRSGRDRRTSGTYLYTGPERRVLKYRRSDGAAVCIYCGKACGESKGWTQGASTIETVVECRTGICIECCSSK